MSAPRDFEHEPDPLDGWDPRRRQALENLWASFAAASGGKVKLADELIDERRAESRAEDSRTPSL